MNRDDSDKKYFLVRKIQTCNHSWPFKKLTIISADSFQERDRERYEPRLSKEQQLAQDNEMDLSAEDNPSVNETEFTMKFDQTGRFPFLDTLSVTKKRQQNGSEEVIYEVVGVYQVSQMPDNYVVNQGSLAKENYAKDNKISPVQLRHEGSPSKIKSLNDISIIFRKIEMKHDNWNITALPLDRIDNTVPYGLFDFKDSKWSQVFDKNIDKSRNRKGLLLKIDIRGGFSLYCLDIEPYKNTTYSLFLFAHPQMNMGLVEPKDIVDIINKNKGRKIRKTLESKFSSVTPLKHIDSLSNPIENRIVEQIEKIMKQN